MADPEAPDDAPPASKDTFEKKNDGPGKGDLAAFGIGCLIFVLFFVGVIIAAATRE